MLLAELAELAKPTLKEEEGEVAKQRFHESVVTPAWAGFCRPQSGCRDGT